MNDREHGRRRFLKECAAVTGLAVGGINSASGQTPAPAAPEPGPKSYPAVGDPSRFETSERWRGVWGATTPLQDSVGIITPSSLHFMAAHGYDPPNIDPRQHRLMIHGLVERPLIFTLEDLKRLPSVSRIHFVECRQNGRPLDPHRETVQQMYGYTSCSEWTGVPLSILLNEAGLQKAASWLVAEGLDPGMHTKSLPLTKALHDCLVVYGQNGEAIRPEQGYPFRLLVPGWLGVYNVKWLRRIKLLDQPHMTKWETTAYGELLRDGKMRWFQFEAPPNSVITRPSGGQQLAGPGFHEITGLAWSGYGAIRKVEVSTDRGRTWTDARLQEPVFSKAHARFRFDWTWDGQEAVLQSRCTDEQGHLQSAHLIQPWKVTREGSVRNALL